MTNSDRIAKLNRANLEAQSRLQARMSDYQAACVNGSPHGIDSARLEAVTAFENTLDCVAALYDECR